MKIFIRIMVFVGALTFATPQIAQAMCAVEIIEQEEKASVSVSESTLRVVGCAGEVVAIYNVTGVQIMTFKVDGQDKHYDLNLAKGCYIVKVGKIVRKIYIR